MKNQLTLADESQEYRDFVDKFKPKKTTDDCYTPEPIFECVLDYVVRTYGIDREKVVRPFWPGGDYENEAYPDGCVVVDNPPFSILAQIITFYASEGVDFFLFAPALTLFSSSSSSSCAIAVGADLVYENGAHVPTSFVTSLEDNRCRTAPDLYEALTEAVKAYTSQGKAQLPKYIYPYDVLTAARLQWLGQHGERLTIKKSESVRISALDSQKAVGKAIFGSGYLLSERAAAERAAAERAAAERAAAERAAAERAAAERWQLSERERKIQAMLHE